MGLDSAMNDGPPGWYGKLSTLGDFATRRLPPTPQQALDHWLSEVVAGSRQLLGEDWLERYLDSPLQRFVVGPDVIDGAWWFGILMPSCDNVGRYFPLVVLQPRAALPSDRVGLDHLERWWQGVGEASLETLADEVDVERFDRALAALPPWPAAQAAPSWAPLWPDPANPAHGAGETRLPAACSAADLVQGWVAADWARRLHGHSLWWSWRPQGGASSARVVAGLPSVAAFAAMLGPGA